MNRTPPRFTLNMANGLGTLKTRKIKIHRDGGRVQGKSDAQQFFQFLIVLDFEATCWPREGSDSRQPPSEIIEFPAVLLRTLDGAVLDVFHTFVLPTEQHKLSEFCKQLTGISQAEVDAGVPLGTAIMLFSRWLEAAKQKHKFVVNEVTKDKQRATFLTWSDWDLNICLASECKRKQIKKPEYFNAWGDLRHIYAKFYARRPHGLRGALQDVGIAFEGREHSGLCDAKNTAQLAWKLMQENCLMVVTKYSAGANIAAELKNMSVSTASARQQQSMTKVQQASKGDENNYKTPEATNVFTRKLFKRTPPLCNCGRRAKFLTVQTPGPNVGRTFFACSNGNNRAASSARGCKFFLWETNHGQSPVLRLRTPKCATSVRTEEEMVQSSPSEVINSSVFMVVKNPEGVESPQQYFGNVQLFQKTPETSKLTYTVLQNSAQ